MRIAPVSGYKNCPIKYNNRFVTFGDKKDSVSFSGKIGKNDEKSIPLTSVEEKKSLEIKYAMGEALLFAYHAKQQGKYAYKEAKHYYKLGKTSNFEGYIPVGDNEDTKLLFNNFDEKTGLPGDFIRIKFKNGMNVITGVKLHDGLKLFTFQDCEDDERYRFISVLKKKALHYKEYNIKTGKTKEIALSKDGYTYFEGYTDMEGNVIKPEIEAVLSDNPTKSEYKETKDGKTCVYKFDTDTQMWVKSDI